MDFELILDSNPNSIFVIEPLVNNGICYDFYYRYVNESFSLLLGIDRTELINRTFSEVFNAIGEKHWLDLFYNTVRLKKAMAQEGDSTFINKRMHIQTYPILSKLCVCEIIDVQGIIEKENEVLFERANKDYLTGAYNRQYFAEYTANLSAKESFAMFMIDVNNLKKTNDTLGHLEGDKLIVSIVNLLREKLSSFTIFRVGGDEFVGVWINPTKEAFIEETEEFKKLVRENKMCSFGCYYFDSSPNIFDALDLCDKLQYENKREQKRSLA